MPTIFLFFNLPSPFGQFHKPHSFKIVLFIYLFTHYSFLFLIQQIKSHNWLRTNKVFHISLIRPLIIWQTPFLKCLLIPPKSVEPKIWPSFKIQSLRPWAIKMKRKTKILSSWLQRMSNNLQSKPVQGKRFLSQISIETPKDPWRTNRQVRIQRPYQFITHGFRWDNFWPAELVQPLKWGIIRVIVLNSKQKKIQKDYEKEKDSESKASARQGRKIRFAL